MISDIRNFYNLPDGLQDDLILGEMLFYQGTEKYTKVFPIDKLRELDIDTINSICFYLLDADDSIDFQSPIVLLTIDNIFSVLHEKGDIVPLDFDNLHTYKYRLDNREIELQKRRAERQNYGFRY